VKSITSFKSFYFLTKFLHMKTSHIMAIGLGILTLGVSIQTISAQNYDRQNIRNHIQNSERFQNLSTEQKQNFRKKGRKNYGYWRTWKTDVTKTLSKIDNGVVLTLTTENKNLLEKLHAREPHKTRGEIKISKENISNGIKITRTSENREIVEKMHARVDNFKLHRTITRNVENISNGVKITITSTDASMVMKIQERERREPKNSEIKKEVTNIEAGVEITITSENERMVKRIQKRAERRQLRKKGGNLKQFGKRFHKMKRFSQNEQ